MMMLLLQHAMVIQRLRGRGLGRGYACLDSDGCTTQKFVLTARGRRVAVARGVLTAVVAGTIWRVPAPDAGCMQKPSKPTYKWR